MNSLLQVPFSHEVQKMAELQAATCRLFGTTQRVLIVWLLSEGEKTVSEIACGLGASLSSTSQHLRRLELSHVVESRRQHQNIYYRLADSGTSQGCRVLSERPRQQDRRAIQLDPRYRRNR
jgi:DNA-binding transcriptional ArsR family regulator